MEDTLMIEPVFGKGPLAATNRGKKATETVVKDLEV